MPSRYAYSRFGGWWSSRTTLERILLGVTIVTILIIFILSLVLKKPASTVRNDSVHFKDNICNTTTCLIEASKLLQFIDTTVDPCDDFNKFVCGKFLKNAHGDESLSVLRSIKAQEERSLLEMYTEDIHNDEHKLVKYVKILFKNCMNEKKIKEDGLNTIKEAIRQVGGWPLVDGDGWDENKFHWFKSSYKLREIGYNFSIFFDLGLTWYGEDDKLRLQIKIVEPPEIEPIENMDFMYESLYVDIMSETAMAFGAVNKSSVLDEVTATYNFIKNLKTEYWHGLKEKLTIAELQKKAPAIDWLEFINKLLYPNVQVTEDEEIVAPTAYNMLSWINRITNSNKRIQANYMIWKVIQEALPYTADEYQILKINNKLQTRPRTKFCKQEIEKRFIPSPIDIMYNRKYITDGQRKAMTDILLNLKTEYIKILKNIEWLDEKDKTNVVIAANNMTVLVGTPEYDFDDKIFDGLDLNEVELQNKTFLSLIAQANKHRSSEMYEKLIEPTTSQHYFNHEDLKDKLATYLDVDNQIFFPASVVIHGLAINDETPNYLKYGAIGFPFISLLLAHMVGFNNYRNKIAEFSNTSFAQYKLKTSCMQKEIKDYKLSSMVFGGELAMYRSMSEQLAYRAYNTWTRNNMEEPKLIGLNYTPKQLLWISATSRYCFPINRYSEIPAIFKQHYNLFSDVITTSLRNIPDFANDFKCAAGTRMNPTNRCILLK